MCRHGKCAEDKQHHAEKWKLPYCKIPRISLFWISEKEEIVVRMKLRNQRKIFAKRELLFKGLVKLIGEIPMDLTLSS
jgi:hypothetical protein